MCLQTEPTVPVEIKIIEGEPHILGWKRFFLAKKYIEPYVICHVSYAISQLENNFLQFKESYVALQDIRVRCKTQEGESFTATSSRAIPAGMHISLLRETASATIPVLVPLQSVIFFSKSQMTASTFLVPTSEWAYNNLKLDPAREHSLQTLWNNYKNK